jgi:TolA-binding protein
MKLIITALLLSGLSAAAYAAAPAGEASKPTKEERFAQAKQEVLKVIDTRIQAIQKARECVAAAQNMPAVNSCREQEKTALKGIRDTIKENRLERLEEKSQKLEEAKKKIDEKKAKLQQEKPADPK